MKQLFILMLFVTASVFAQQEIYFLSDPAPSPDGSEIVFTYDNDLWKVSSQGGTAVRLTGMDGMEDRAVFSPDGKWIAFTGREQGNSNIYIMPANGGEIKQLTYHDRADLVETFSWDSEYIYFTSTRYNQSTTFKIPVGGGTPERIFEHYFNRPHNIALHPIKNEIYFNESWESFRFTNRKKYKGDYNPDVKSYNFDTKEFTQLTDYEGKDFWQTIDKNGNIYFVSDEYNDEYNLYTFVNGIKTQLTEFPQSIKNPQVSADGSVVVFEKDYRLFVYNTQTKQSKILPVSLYINNTLNLEQSFDVSGKITNFSVSPDNKKMCFVSRGRLFVSDVEGKFVRELNTNPGERVTEVLWVGKDETILYCQTVMGCENLFTIKADGTGEPKQITKEQENNNELIMNDDRSMVTYFSGRNELCLLDIEKMENEVIATGEFWELSRTSAAFSPDNKWIAYTTYEGFEQDVKVYSIDEKKSYNITKTGVSETNPYWGPDGKYLYYASDPYDPSYPNGTRDAEIFRVPLRKLGSDFKMKKFDELFKETEKDTNKPEVTIDFTNIADRAEGIVTKPGNQYSFFIKKDGDKTYLVYGSGHGGDGYNLYNLTMEPFESNKTEEVKGAKTSWGLVSEAKGNSYILFNGSIHKLNLSQNKVDKIDISYTFDKDLEDEFPQMFYETWAALEQNYYDENFHGVDWKVKRDYYAKFLPYLISRENLRTLLNDLQGELNSSHQGFYSNGDEENVYYKASTNATGIMFKQDSPYTVDYIAAKSSADNEDVDVKPGDVLTAVNGTNVDKSRNREYYFTSPKSMDELKLTFTRNGNEFDVYIKPQSSGALDENLYDEWVASRQKAVDEKTNKRAAYIHMKNMGGGELNNFMKEMINEAHYRDALILDIRNNRGGNVHDEVLNFLSREPYLNWQYRGGQLSDQPHFAPAAKPIVLLINEQSLSDAEMTAAGFKALGLGKIIGTETYRWIIFTSGGSLVDGSGYRLPSWGCYTLEGDDLEMTGVAPDIYVKNTFKDRLEGNDPQLDRAIEEILKELK